MLIEWFVGVFILAATVWAFRVDRLLSKSVHRLDFHLDPEKSGSLSHRVQRHSDSIVEIQGQLVSHRQALDTMSLTTATEEELDQVSRIIQAARGIARGSAQ